METIRTEVVEDKNLSETRGRRIMDAQRREELLARYRAISTSIASGSRKARHVTDEKTPGHILAQREWSALQATLLGALFEQLRQAEQRRRELEKLMVCELIARPEWARVWPLMGVRAPGGLRPGGDDRGNPPLPHGEEILLLHRTLAAQDTIGQGRKDLQALLVQSAQNALVQQAARCTNGDESLLCASTATSRSRRWRASCVCAVPHGHWQSNSFIAALRMKSMGAPFLIEGAVNGEGFARYAEEVLCPELRPGEIVVMDNVGAHKNKRAVELIRARGARVMYLPAYSPDLNPIEMAFSKLKAQLRGRGTRNLKDLMSALAQILRTFSARQCRNFFRHANMRLSKSKML